MHWAWLHACFLEVTESVHCRLPGAGAKDKLGLRMHGLIVGSPDKKRADPAVLRALCSHVLPSGKQEVQQLHLHASVPHPLDVHSLPLAVPNVSALAHDVQTDIALPSARQSDAQVPSKLLPGVHECLQMHAVPGNQ